MIHLSNNEYFYLLIGMILVTIVPRLLPQLSWNPEKISPRLQYMLGLVPFAILSALLIPGVFTGMANTPLVAVIVAVAAALAMAWYEMNIILIVMAAIGLHYFVSTLF